MPHARVGGGGTASVECAPEQMGVRWRIALATPLALHVATAIAMREAQNIPNSVVPTGRSWLNAVEMVGAFFDVIVSVRPEKLSNFFDVLR